MKVSSLNATSDTQSTIGGTTGVESGEAVQVNIPFDSSVHVNEMTDEKGNPTEQTYQIATNKLNEFMEYSQKDSKFVFHKDLERYYVEIVDAQTQEVIKEIPPKELLDAYYEMQKVAGKIFDTQA